MKQPKNKLNNLISASILALILVSVSCEADLDQIKALSYKEELPNIIIENFNAKYSVNGNLQVKLNAPKAFRYTTEKKNYSQFPKGIELKFFDRNMNMHSSLNADYAIYYETKNFAKAKGNVILTNLKGSVLTTEELLIDEKEEKIYSLVPVKIQDEDGFEITGKGGFESNLDFTVYKFTDVSGIKILNEEEEEPFSNESEKPTKHNGSSNKNK